MHFSHIVPEASLIQLAVSYGAWAVFVSVMLESTGLPLPSESILIAVAVLSAGSDPHAPTLLPVILAATTGAVLGDHVVYAIGRIAGTRMLARFGPGLGFGPARQRLGHYLFQRYGERIVIAARFMPMLRTAVSFLAGTTRMPWLRFLAYDASGAALWAGVIGGSAYLFGERVRTWSWPVSFTCLALWAAALIIGAILLKRQEAQLQAEADRRPPL